jgi:hypothetical protein
MPATVAIIALVIVGIIAALARSWQRKSELSSIIRRPPLNDDEIFLTYYGNSGLSNESVIEVWREIATQLNLPPERLRPLDRFGKDIGRYIITSENLDSLNDAARHRAKASGIVYDISKISSIDEYIRAFAKSNTTTRVS